MAAATTAGAVGIIMAGGSGERMKASGEVVLKPLVTVLGQPLIERNLTAMIRAGISDIRVVAAGPGGKQVARWADERGGPLAAAGGASLAIIVEAERLGNCGGLAIAVGPDDGDVILVFADNLTDLDLADFVRYHREQDAALTLAVHSEPFRLPYGVVDVADGAVTGYHEKPWLEVQVSSGLAVVGPSARALLDGPASLSDLTNAAVGAALATATYCHAARWIDVNDTAKVASAHDMVMSASQRFESFWPPHILGSGPTDANDQGLSPNRSQLIDDLDRLGQPRRLDVAAAQPDQVNTAGWDRVVAWRTALADQSP
jgi:NDP-sugar pyrophosphorylase family protein